jgi:hypothetical protein
VSTTLGADTGCGGAVGVVGVGRVVGLPEVVEGRVVAVEGVVGEGVFCKIAVLGGPERFWRAFSWFAAFAGGRLGG